MKDLIYKEDDSLRTFVQEDFTYVYDKGSYASFSWGATRDENPRFNPIGPEVVEIRIGRGYKFDERRLKDLLVLPTEKEDDFVSVCRQAVIVADGQIEEAVRIAESLDERRVFALIKLDYADYSTLRDAVKLKVHGVKRVLLVARWSFGLSSCVKNFIDNGVFVSLLFDYPADVSACLDELEKLPELLPAAFKLSSKENAATVESFMKSHAGRPVKIVEDDLAKIGKHSIRASFDPGLFSCVIDFEAGLVYPSSQKTAMSLESIKTMPEYWHSKLFESYRKRALKRLDSIGKSNDIETTSREANDKEMNQ